jgi:AcrR family transcriptional regulator
MMRKASASSREMLERAINGETVRQIAADVGISHQAVWHRIRTAAAEAKRTDELESAFRTRRRGPEGMAPPRELVAIVARSGSVATAAAQLGFSPEAVSFRLGSFYRSHGYNRGMHALWHEFVKPQRRSPTAKRTDELESAFRTRRRGPEGMAPPRELLAIVARSGSVATAAAQLGFSGQAVKNRLSKFYKSHGYRSGMQAVWHEFVALDRESPGPPPARTRRKRR